MDTDARVKSRDLYLITLLLLLGAVYRVWVLANTDIVARDGLGYMRLAWEWQQSPSPAVLRQGQQHPLYPWCIAAVQPWVERLSGRHDSWPWQWSAQGVNMAFSLLLIVPMYLLGLILFNHRVAFWATFLFQVLPVPARVLTDALSEGTCLLGMATAIALLARACMHWSWLLFFLGGIAGGLAYLARPEGALPVIAVLLGSWWVAWKSSARPACKRLLTCHLALLAGLGAMVVPYCLLIGGLSVKPTFHKLLNYNAHNCWPSDSPQAANAVRPSSMQAAGACRLVVAARFTAQWSHDAPCLLRAAALVSDEVAKGFHYVLWLPALIGLARAVRQWRTGHVNVILALLIAVHFLVLLRLAYVVHYVSERHTLAIVLAGMYWAMAEVETWYKLGLARLTRLGPVAAARGAFLFWLAVSVFLIATGLRIVKPLHEHRRAHRSAGEWLAQHTTIADGLTDPYGWAGFYAGRLFEQRQAVSRAAAGTRCYVVREIGEQDPQKLRVIEEALAPLTQITVVYRQQPRGGVGVEILQGIRPNSGPLTFRQVE
ncbi:MAG: hypothetical protein C4297_03170 [Gemmataceae bacterium]